MHKGIWSVLLGAGLLTLTSAVVAADEGSAEKHTVQGLMKDKLCGLCHTDEKLSRAGAPSFRAVAERYRSVPEGRQLVAKRLSTGSMRNWGTAVMPGYDSVGKHKDDIQILVDYIFQQGK